MSVITRELHQATSPGIFTVYTKVIYTIKTSPPGHVTWHIHYSLLTPWWYTYIYVNVPRYLQQATSPGIFSVYPKVRCNKLLHQATLTGIFTVYTSYTSNFTKIYLYQDIHQATSPGTFTVYTKVIYIKSSPPDQATWQLHCLRKGYIYQERHLHWARSPGRFAVYTKVIYSKKDISTGPRHLAASLFTPR